MPILKERKCLTFRQKTSEVKTDSTERNIKAPTYLQKIIVGTVTRNEVRFRVG
jgi:hypothetical protein